MNNEENILVILTPAFPANESDENWVPSQQMFVRSVKKLYPGVNIIILSLIYPYHDQSYQWNGINVIPFNGNRYRKLRRPFLWRMIWKKLSELHKEKKIKAILSFWCTESALVGHYFSRRHDICHRTWISGQDARKKNKLVKFIRPSADELVAMSDFLIGEFQKNHHIKPAHFIPMGVDPLLFSAPAVQRDIDVMGAGSFNPLKQYHIFVEVIAEVKKHLPNIKSMLCGDGEEYERLRSLRDTLSLEENIIFCGMTKPADTVKLMQRSKVLLHTSSYEGFSLACYEGLYGGAHVISFVKTMYHDIRHWHVVNSKEEMVRKTLELLTDRMLDHEPVFTYSMDDSARSMMHLLGVGGK